MDFLFTCSDIYDKRRTVQLEAVIKKFDEKFLRAHVSVDGREL